MATVGQILANIDPILVKEVPDSFLVLGDTNFCLCAIAAKRHQIPIFHMEAGNRCFDQRVPEETNRKIVDHVANINLTYSDIAREYLLAEGLPADQIIKKGSPMFEVLNKKMDNIKNAESYKKLGLEKGQYFVVSAHRDENISSERNFLNLVNSLNEIAKVYQLPVIVSTHPRTRKMIEEKGVKFNELVQLMKPMGFTEYNNLQLNSKAVLSDSGTISEESSILKFKALNLREAHERPEAMEEGAVMMVGLEKDRIMQGLTILDKQEGHTLRLVADYSMANVSEKVLRIIVSYTNYVKQKIWKNE